MLCYLEFICEYFFVNCMQILHFSNNSKWTKLEVFFIISFFNKLAHTGIPMTSHVTSLYNVYVGYVLLLTYY